MYKKFLKKYENLEPLIKAPVIGEPSQEFEEDFKPDTGEKYQHVESNQFKNGMHHHVFSGPHGQTTHVMSSSDNPHDKDSHVAYISGTTWKEGEPYQVGVSKVKKEHRGNQYGRHLYLAALAHHGNIDSDYSISEKASKAWQSLPELSGGIAQVSFGREGAEEPHSATANSDELKNHLFHLKQPAEQSRQDTSYPTIPGTMQTKKKSEKLYSSEEVLSVIKKHLIEKIKQKIEKTSD